MVFWVDQRFKNGVNNIEELNNYSHIYILSVTIT